jgi:hypothetical protein
VYLSPADNPAGPVRSRSRDMVLIEFIPITLSVARV